MSVTFQDMFIHSVSAVRSVHCFLLNHVNQRSTEGRLLRDYDGLTTTGLDLLLFFSKAKNENLVHQPDHIFILQKVCVCVSETQTGDPLRPSSGSGKMCSLSDLSSSEI